MLSHLNKKRIYSIKKNIKKILPKKSRSRNLVASITKKSKKKMRDLYNPVPLIKKVKNSSVKFKNEKKKNLFSKSSKSAEKKSYLWRKSGHLI